LQRRLPDLKESPTLPKNMCPVHVYATETGSHGFRGGARGTDETLPYDRSSPRVAGCRRLRVTRKQHLGQELRRDVCLRCQINNANHVCTVQYVQKSSLYLDVFYILFHCTRIQIGICNYFFPCIAPTT